MWWVQLRLSLISHTYITLFDKRTRKSKEKGINNRLTTKARQSWITFVCFGIAKLWCFGLHNLVLLLSLICPCMIYSKRKYAKKNKSKKNQNAFRYGCKRVSRRCGSYRMYLEGDSPHQVVLIMSECIWFSHISNLHNMRHLCTLAMFHT